MYRFCKFCDHHRKSNSYERVVLKKVFDRSYPKYLFCHRNHYIRWNHHIFHSAIPLVSGLTQFYIVLELLLSIHLEWVYIIV